jgi:hypothetical protein
VTWHRIYEFWISEQGVPGSLLGDFLVFATTYLIGKYKVAPWLHKRHCEHLEQKDQQHKEILQAHQRLLDQHAEQHKQLVEQHHALLDAVHRSAESSGTAAPTVGV